MFNKNYNTVVLIVRIILSYLIMIFTAYGCEKNLKNQDEDSIKTYTQNQECNEDDIIETYTNILGKIFINNRYFTYGGDTAYIYAITTSHKDFYSDDVTFFHSEPWTINNDSILAPINLPDEFQIDNLRIVISGYKLNCCKVLTQPDWRASYGCRCKITDIKLYLN